MAELGYDSATATDVDAALPVPPAGKSPRQHDNSLIRQRALVAIGRSAAGTAEDPELVQNAAALLAEALDADYSGAAELSSNGDFLDLRIREAETESGKADPCTTASQKQCRSGETGTIKHEIDLNDTSSFAGYAFAEGRPVLAADLAEEDGFDDPPLRRLGVNSAISAPLKLQDESFGILTAYSRHKDRFSEEDLLFAEAIAHLVAGTIARERVERSLFEERRLAVEVLQNVDAAVLMLDPKWEIVRINPACKKITGFSIAELRGRCLWNVFSLPAETEMFHGAKEKLQPAAGAIEFESHLLTKHAQQRLIAWSFTAVAGSDGTTQSIIASGIDVTSRQEAEERAEMAEKAAEIARQTPANSDRGAGQSADGAFSRLPTPSNAERRKRPRRSYPYSQHVAPIIDDKLPGEDEFEEVQCNDIAAGGFSFVSAKPLPSDKLVVALGIPPKITYLIAQIAHVTRVERDGEKMFLSGCNYVGRATY